HVFGQTFTVVLLAGFVLALVAVVDDAINAVEGVSRRLTTDIAASNGSERVSKAQLVASGTVETGRNLVWAAAVLGLALTPIFLIDGVSGDAFFPPVATACLVAVVTSLIVTITLVPALCLAVLPQPTRALPATAERMRHRYQRIVAAFSRSIVPAVAVAVV